MAYGIFVCQDIVYLVFQSDKAQPVMSDKTQPCSLGDNNLLQQLEIYIVC